MILTIIKGVLVFLLAILVHELGHYVMFRRYKIKPKIEFNFLRISMSSPKIYTLYPSQFFMINYIGVLAGGLVLLIFNLIIIYFYCIF